MAEDAVDGGTRAAHVRAKGTLGPELFGDLATPGRRGEVVGRKRSKIARAPAALERVEEGQATGLEAGPAPEVVETPVNLRCRRLLSPKGQGDDEPVILGQIKQPQTLTRPLGELRPRLEKEGDVGADARRDLREGVRPQRLFERLIGEHEGGGRVGAPAPEP